MLTQTLARTLEVTLAQVGLLMRHHHHHHRVHHVHRREGGRSNHRDGDESRPDVIWISALSLMNQTKVEEEASRMMK